MNLIYPRLPEGYAELEYIESTGTQYINTGVVPGENLRAVLDIKTTADATRDDCNFFGVAQGDRVYINATESTPKWQFGFGSGNTGYWAGGTINSTTRYLIDVLITTSEQRLTVNNVSLYTGTGQFTRTITNPAHLFNVNGTSFNGKFICYFCKIYSGSTLVRHMIPAQRNSDSAVGMYDLVNDVFYTNAGTGAFTAGPKLHYVKGIRAGKLINVWDEQWKTGLYSIQNGTWSENVDRICSKNPIPVQPEQTYYWYNDASLGWVIFYKADNTFISAYNVSPSGDHTFTTPALCDHIQFDVAGTYGATYQNDICINLSDPAINGHYYPYAKAIKSIAIGEDVIWSVPAARQETIDEVFVPSVWTDEDLNNMPEESTIETGENQLTIEEVEDNEPAEQEIQDSGESRIYEESGTDSSEDIDQIRMEVNDNEFTE